MGKGGKVASLWGGHYNKNKERS